MLQKTMREWAALFGSLARISYMVITQKGGWQQDAEKKGDQMKHKKHAKKQLEWSLALGEIPASMIAPTYTHARLSDLQSTPEY